MNKQLNIVSFDVPYPPNYGGVIDVFYKIKALFNLGIKIHLHVFEYGRKQSNELEKYCESVTYYKRSKAISHIFSLSPYIVSTRKSNRLVNNLNKNGFPTLFDGLHTTANMNTISSKCYVRTHNIEHLLYYGHAKSEKNIFKKLFFYIEGFKLKLYEKTLQKADGIFTISPIEQTYFLAKYGQKTRYVPVFHNDIFRKDISKKSNKVLWHGNLNVSDNVKTAETLITIFKNTSISLIIASSFEKSSIISKINQYQNIEFVNTEKEGVLENLLETAQVNILLTYQQTGIKLKLLYSLYKGKFIVANDKMIDDTGLERLCKRANSHEEILNTTKQLLTATFNEDNIEERKQILEQFSTEKSAQKIIDTIF